MTAQEMVVQSSRHHVSLSLSCASDNPQVLVLVSSSVASTCPCTWEATSWQLRIDHANHTNHDYNVHILYLIVGRRSSEQLVPTAPLVPYIRIEIDFLISTTWHCKTTRCLHHHDSKRWSKLQKDSSCNRLFLQHTSAPLECVPCKAQSAWNF